MASAGIKKQNCLWDWPEIFHRLTTQEQRREEDLGFRQQPKIEKAVWRGEDVVWGNKWQDRDLTVGVDSMRNARVSTMLEVDRTVLTPYIVRVSNSLAQVPNCCQNAKPANRDIS